VIISVSKTDRWAKDLDPESDSALEATIDWGCGRAASGKGGKFMASRKESTKIEGILVRNLSQTK
jgi:hypothetical protein